MTDTSTKEKVKAQTHQEVKEPGLYKVIYMNDELTTMEFVIETLLDIFDYTPPAAEEITVKIHDDGHAVVAVLPFELAEQKGIEVTVLARGRGFPLQVKVEKE
jgi:ATP-dependent Clp protease adaptor protein ClpS